MLLTESIDGKDGGLLLGICPVGCLGSEVGRSIDARFWEAMVIRVGPGYGVEGSSAVTEAALPSEGIGAMGGGFFLDICLVGRLGGKVGRSTDAPFRAVVAIRIISTRDTSGGYGIGGLLAMLVIVPSKSIGSAD